ncbi:hypothetical protein GCM10010969_02570 [Saccharibacillus kuerlensis]|uniref:Uncharacterized protein n=1 Tax=Saccharibacillus kuerlensis TaxID=459527 RepID=A0ABQ2KRL5_9BACL|nr:hypothetical protein GCM10010969_02570 [Saccharibacillus kuerlensis]
MSEKFLAHALAVTRRLVYSNVKKRFIAFIIKGTGGGRQLLYEKNYHNNKRKYENLFV